MTDRFTVRAVVLGLIGIVVLCVLGAVALTWHGQDIPEFLKYVGTAGIGLVGGILSKTATEIQPVNVVGQPVETTEVPAKRKRDRGAVDGVTIVVVLVVAFVVLLLLGVIR